ncbi:hypothetical protein GJ697_04850 [Pseudoduganella sp. FT25W]|uniref:Uncharacterized protein n=1 Tax=Duganella alba TaxID=2666081 RepID=A0A6L5QC50_9BURK|nr:hypothetical protein [Duganella alba]MRX07160.1 hypothetical protein [Duganella alba]MRX15145.1 hypothetical protein [Duganella alba]
MGLFSFLSRKKEEPTPQLKPGRMPTVSAEPKMSSAYETVFYDVMADVDGFTPEEMDAMLRFIVDGDGGHLNMGRYHKPIFSRYFSARSWSWSEYEYWDKTYRKMGQKPLRFQPGLAVPIDRTIVLTAEQVLNDLKVVDLKEFIESHAVSVPPKAKKKDLLELAYSIPNLHETQLWREKATAVQAEIGYPLYSLLMRYISFKAGFAFDRDRVKSLGITEFKHVFIESGDEQFVQLALKRNPEALPPYFPGDVTMRRSVIPGFEE